MGSARKSVTSLCIFLGHGNTSYYWQSFTLLHTSPMMVCMGRLHLSQAILICHCVMSLLLHSKTHAAESEPREAHLFRLTDIKDWIYT